MVARGDTFFKPLGSGKRGNVFQFSISLLNERTCKKLPVCSVVHLCNVEKKMEDCDISHFFWPNRDSGRYYKTDQISTCSGTLQG